METPPGPAPTAPGHRKYGPVDTKEMLPQATVRITHTEGQPPADQGLGPTAAATRASEKGLRWASGCEAPGEGPGGPEPMSGLEEESPERDAKLRFGCHPEGKGGRPAGPAQKCPRKREHPRFRGKGLLRGPITAPS